MCLDLNKIVESLQKDLEAAQESTSRYASASDREAILEDELAKLRAANAALEIQLKQKSQDFKGKSWHDDEDARVSFPFQHK